MLEEALRGKPLKVINEHRALVPEHTYVLVRYFWLQISWPPSYPHEISPMKALALAGTP